MGLFEILQKGLEAVNKAAGEVNKEYQEAYERGLTMSESKLRDRVLSTHSAGGKAGYLKAYREKYGEGVE